MTQHAFLMVCIARPLDKWSTAHIALASTVNLALASDLGNGWVSTPRFTGAIHGTIQLQDSIPHRMRSEAQALIRTALRALLDQHGSAFDVLIDVLLMVDGLGQAMIFEV